MKGKFEYKKKHGLPNGANEMETVLKAFFEARMAPFFKGGGPTKKQIATDPELRDWDKYNTELTEDELKSFNQWKVDSKIGSWDRGAYDIQGYYKGQVLGQGFDAVDAEGHRPDTYKKPNHPTFSDQSKYSKEAPAGFWEDDKYWAPSTHKDLYGPEYYNWMKERNIEDGRSEHLAGYMLPEVVINAPKKLVYKKGGVIEESYEINASDDAIKYYESLGYKVEYVDGGATQDFDKEEYGWQYKKEDDKYLTRKSGDVDWITAKGNALNAIKYDVYNETPEAMFDPTVVQSGSKQQQQTKQKGSYIKNLQTKLLDDGYYIGPTEDDGISGSYTQNALAAYEAGVPSEEYNKKFKKTSLQTNPDVKVPTALVERAQGIQRPKSPKLSANAALSLEDTEEDTEEQPKENLKSLLPGTQKKLTEGKQEKGARTESEEYNYIPILDPDNLDEAYSHLDDFMIDFEKAWNSTDDDKLNRKFTEIHTRAGSCLKGAKMCNAEFVANKVGANSIAGLFNEIHQTKNTSTFDPKMPWGISADQTKYSIPSRAGSVGQTKTGEYKDTKGFDAWEGADALIGEGLGTELYSTSVTDKAWKNRSAEFEAKNKGMTEDFYNNYVINGKIPLGALIFEGNASGNYTDPKYGERARHAMTVIGFDKKDGMPLIYDSGQIRRINNRQFDMPITRVVIPKGYENYTLGNLKKGQALRYKELGYDNEPNKVEYKSDDKLKPYVNTVKKGMHQHAYKIANDYNMDKDIMDKMQNRVVGLAEVESNFNNEGDRDLNWKRDLKIATEGYLQNAGKYAWKWAEDAFNIESDVKGYQDWQVETEALGNLKKQGVNPFAAGTTKTESGKTRNLLQEEINKMRSSGNYPEWDKDLDQSKRSGEYESSVGPLQIKKLPLYVEKELGIDKSDLYGSTVDDNKELENSSAAALVHLVESYKKLDKKYNKEMDMNLTEDQLIDLATVAYNNASKANSEKFVKNYILNKELKDSYLTSVHAGEAEYNNTTNKYIQEVTQFRSKYNTAPSKDVYDNDLLAQIKTKAYNQKPLAPLKPSEQQKQNSVSNSDSKDILSQFDPLSAYRATSFKDGGEVQDIYEYLNNKLSYR